jgi:hypothetical protein
MFLLLALLLLGSSPAVGAERLAVQLSVAADTVTTAPEAAALEAGVTSLFARQYGRFAEISFGEGAEDASGAAAAQVTVQLRDGALVVSTTLTGKGEARTLDSVVPAGAPASLVATMTGDLAFLLFSPGGFSAFPLSPPPRLAGILSVDALQALTGWDSAELDPIGLAGFGDELTVCFPHRYLTLGPLFRLTASTLVDLNNQASGPEPLQLSGVARDGDQRLLLCEAQGKVASVDARAGTRRLLTVPGISALPARALAAGNLAFLSDAPAAALTIVSLDTPRRWQVRVRASYASAFCPDAEGNLWVWDAGERRIRVLTPGGREVYSVRPLFPASTMQLPQQVEVYADGSFLLGGSGEVWKFENSGIPVWRLTRVPGATAELLPAGFALAAGGADGAFTLLDGPSRRLLSFAPAADEDTLGSLLSRMSTRSTADVREASRLARADGLYLVALQLGELLVRRGAEEEERAAARAALLLQKTRLYADLGESLVRDLRYDRAEGAFLRAAESARELAAEAPEEPEAARLLQQAASRQQEVHAALGRQAEAPRIFTPRASVQTAGTCERLLVARLQVRNDGPVALERVSLRLSVPAVAPAPAQATIESLAPREQREISIRLGLRESAVPPAAGRVLAAGLLVSFKRGIEEVSVPAAFSLSVGETGPFAADPLLCRALPGDPLIAGLKDDLLSGRHDGLTALAGILDGMGAYRDRAAGADPEPSLRATLRSLSADEKEWTLLTISAAAAVGLPAGLIRWPDRAVALVDTGIPLSQAFEALPALERWAAPLGALSRGGSLCVPLSGLPPRAGGRVSPTAQALRGALELCAARGVVNARVAWLDGVGTSARRAAPLPVPFPFLLPLVPREVDTVSLLDGLDTALSAAR